MGDADADGRLTIPELEAAISGHKRGNEVWADPSWPPGSPRGRSPSMARSLSRGNSLLRSLELSQELPSRSSEMRELNFRSPREIREYSDHLHGLHAAKLDRRHITRVQMEKE